jgi:succinyl-diaminopimelate desuccinylase
VKFTRPKIGTDLLLRTAELVDISSVSHNEAIITSQIESELRAIPWLETVRVGDNVVARTNLGRPMRLALGGHTDTVPPTAENVHARLDGDTLWGIGSADMKGGLAVMLELARTVSEPAVDVTFIFYACEEVAIQHNGLRHLARERPDLLVADAAILGEPTAAVLEAGCQGTMRLRVHVAGVRAHAARGWLGRNAIHRLGRVLQVLEDYEPRRPIIQGCEYREGLQAVYVDGGTAGNVVPDHATVTINHRFAPDRSPAEAEAHIRELLAPVLDEGDEIELLDCAAGAAPHLHHPLLAAFAGRNDLAVRAKLGWTDVAFFAERGIPAANFGPGDAEVAHTAGEHLEREFLEFSFHALNDLLRNGV